MAVLNLKTITDQLARKGLLLENSTAGKVAAGGAESSATATTAELTFSGVSTDTRTIQPGELFVALQGENFDGHNFIATALERGAAGVICRYWPHWLATAESDMTAGALTSVSSDKTQPVVLKVTD